MKRLQVKVLLPIVVKFVVTTALMISSVALIIAWKNAELFKQISIDREESTAEILTSGKAMEVEAILTAKIEKLTTLASQGKALTTLSGDLVFLKVEANQPGQPPLELRNLETVKAQSFNYQALIDKHTQALSRLQSGRAYITSVPVEGQAPLLLVAAPVGKENGQVSHWAWGFFKLDRLQSSFTTGTSHVVYLMDENGRLLVHPDEKQTILASDLTGNKAIFQTLKGNLRNQQQYEGEKLYSFTKTDYGPIVVGELSRTSILAPSILARESSYFILGIILSISFFVSFVLSQRMTKNIERLTDFAHRIAEGDFNFTARAEIKTKDEIGLLASAFDDMTEGLKERDKIKSMFTKFHGTAITEELLNLEDMRKGNKSEAVIFFSDIRGFTSFSNDRSPEEVVRMLNSYFEVMVTIINKHGGVVDKFVGDAIMAVWGAPNKTDDDAKNAVLACLEMRKALVLYNEERLARGEPAIMMGMGLHAGPVVSGTVGSNDRLEYTVIGDTVNTASRIESATKSFGTDLLISDEVCKRVEGKFITHIAGDIVAKGKSEALKLAKVSGFLDENGTAILVKTPYSDYEAEESEKVKVA